MASELRVNKINSRTGFGTITVSETGQDLVGITTIENLTTENTLVGAAASFTGNVQVGGVLTYEDVTNIDSVGLITARQGIEVGARPGVAASISVDGNMIVSGISTFDGDVKLSDNKKIVFGAGSDLEIYHDGSSSAILNNNNTQLTISSDNALNLTSRTGQEYFFRGYTGGAAELYHDNSKKLETTANGIIATGNDSTGNILIGDLRLKQTSGDTTYIKWDASHSKLEFIDNVTATFGDANDLQLYHNGSDSYIDEAGTGDLKIRTTNGNGIQLISGSSANMITCATDGAVKLYYNSLQRLETTSSGVTISRSGDPILTVTGSGHAQLNLTTTSGSDHCGVNFGDSDDNNAGMIQYTNSSNYMVFHTNGSEKIRITSDGRIGMGVNPSHGRVQSNPIGFNPFGSTWLSGASYVAAGGYGGGVSLLDGSKGYSLSCYDNGNDFYIFPHSSTTAAGSGGVYINNAATSWSSASDERDKENLVNITDAMTKVKTLRTVIGNYIWKPEVKTPFLIAQDVQAVLPEAVTVRNKNGSEEDRLGMSYQSVIPLVTAALKEAIAEIETLKAEVAALKSN